MQINQYTHRSRRIGATLVEAAFALPVLFLLLFGFLEMAELGMAYQMVTNSAIQGCRVAIIDGATQSDVTTTIQNELAGAGITSSSFTVTTVPSNVTTTHHGDITTVTVSVPFQDIAWIPPVFLGGVTIKAAATDSSERP